MAEPTDYTQPIQDPTEFTLAWTGWADGMSDSDKRKKIKIKLDLYNFGVNPTSVKASGVSEYDSSGASSNDSQPDMSNDMFVNGAVLVKAIYDGTDKTGKVVQGKPVVFDTTTGSAVTGINEKWSPEEYKVVGTSMVDFADTSQTSGKKIPIQLTPPPTAETSVVLGRCVKKTYTETTLQQWLKQGLQRCVWEFEIMSKDIQVTNDGSVLAHPATGSQAQPLRPRLETGYDDSWASSDPTSGSVKGTVVEVFNLLRQFIPIGEVSVLYKRGSQYYCKVPMQAMIIGKLAEMFDGTKATYPEGKAGKLKSLTVCKDYPIDIWDYASLMPGSKLGPNTSVVAGLIRTNLATATPVTNSSLVKNADDKNGGVGEDTGSEDDKLWGLITYSNEYAKTSYIYTLIAVSACPTVVMPPTPPPSGP